MSRNTDTDRTLKHVAGALALTALVLFIPANLLPFMHFETFGKATAPTIYEGVKSLYETGSLFLAVLVFVASIILPALKILVVLWVLAKFRSTPPTATGARVVTVFDTIGRWAMLDVFLLAIFVAIMKFGTAGNSSPGAGAVLFSVVVIATMISYTALERLMSERSLQQT